MDYKDTFNTEKEKSKLIESKNKLITIKSDYFLQKIFHHIKNKILLKIIKCNKDVQKN